MVLVTEGDKHSIFGRNLFNNKNLTFEPSLNIPTPENYVLGPGDEVIIDIWGNSELTVRQVISPEGNINVSNIGPIYLNGKRIQEASSYLKAMFILGFSLRKSINIPESVVGANSKYSSKRDGRDRHARNVYVALFGNGVSRVVCGRRCE